LVGAVAARWSIGQAGASAPPTTENTTDHPIMSNHTKISRIYLEPVSLSDRGQRYRVTHNGVTLIESTKNPKFDSARALLARALSAR